MRTEKGTVILSVALCLIVFCIFTAFTVDLGLGVYNQRQMQTAADASALAGVSKLIETTYSTTDVFNLSRTVGMLNLLSQDEVSKASYLEIGNWNFDTNNFTAYSTPYNAVKAVASREISTFFAGVIGIDVLRLNVDSIAVVSGASESSCLIPFGLTEKTLKGVQYNDLLTVDWNGSGNWGKVQLGNENLTSYPSFTQAMVSGVCMPPISIGDRKDSNTGFAGIVDGFEGRMASNPFVIMPIVDTFGKGKKEVTILGFVAAEILAIDNRGSKWTVEFKILPGLISGQPGGPNESPFAKTRILVK